MGYYGKVKKQPYRPSKGFVAFLGAFLALALIFITLPHMASGLATIPTGLPPFPVSVDPKTKTIQERETFSLTGQSFLAAAVSGLGDGTALLASAIMSTRAFEILDPFSEKVSVRILPGMRSEQVALLLDHELGWTKEQHELFVEELDARGEGRLYPSVYFLNASTTPAEVVAVLGQRFDERVVSRYPSSLEEVVPMEDALTIASIIEREAGNESEMAIISGILWNRLFIDMRLQADSTLSYARGTARNGWWPVPRSRDKYIKSLYNTYQHPGLPPSPIASPSVAAIYAALNPEKTDCVFFFHAKGAFYCSETYEEHVKKLKKIYGRGR